MLPFNMTPARRPRGGNAASQFYDRLYPVMSRVASKKLTFSDGGREGPPLLKRRAQAGTRETPAQMSSLP